ncbi:hypothetical protein AEMCBJ_33560 (plasmid) [Cupriavidus necator]|uniref:hypothetical protein n=1 Tax=Cupriavidus necator TaxID=106590 RepID=UPI003F732DC5
MKSDDKRRVDAFHAFLYLYKREVHIVGDGGAVSVQPRAAPSEVGLSDAELLALLDKSDEDSAT